MNNENEIGTVPAKAKRPQPKGGSRKGKPNKATAELKNMILNALDEAGGVGYLVQQAHANPGAFLSLVGKVLPRDIKADVDVAGKIVIISEFPSD